MPPALPALPPVRVKLIGIAVLPPDKWVLLEVQADSEPAVQFALMPNARRIGLQVIEVDPHACWAKIRNGNAVVTLTVENSAAAPVAINNSGGEHRPLPLLPPPGAGDP